MVATEKFRYLWVHYFFATKEYLVILSCLQVRGAPLVLCIELGMRNAVNLMAQPLIFRRCKGRVIHSL